MFRFLAILIVTGVGVLTAVVWWSDRDAASAWPELPTAETSERAAPARAAPPRAEAAPPQTEEAPPQAAPLRKPKAEAHGVRPSQAAAERRRPPAIPAPTLVPRAAYTRTIAPAPAAFEPIPAPIGGQPAAADGVGETPIPEPTLFEDEAVALAAAKQAPAVTEAEEAPTHAERSSATGLGADDASYGEENVIYVEGDDSFRTPAASPRAVAMRSGHEASAERIRRLLEVYQSLGSRR